MGTFAKRDLGTASSTNFIKLSELEVGTVVINGDRYAGSKEVTGKNGLFTTYLFESDQGEITSVPASGHLKYLLERESQVAIGERTQITYLGKVDVKGRMTNQFELLVEQV